MEMMEARLNNEARYLGLIRRKGKAIATTAQYQSRSATTGNRKLAEADGGVVYGRFLSNSAPVPTPLLIEGSLGAIGFVNQKPS
jgi:hypothetical protein